MLSCFCLCQNGIAGSSNREYYAPVERLVNELQLFDEALIDAMNAVVSLMRSPWSLACLLEAAGPLALERCGALLERWTAEPFAG